MRANFVLSSVASGVRRNLTMTIALVLSTSIALAFVGAAFLADREITKFKKNYESSLSVSVYLCPTTTYTAPCKHPATQAETDALRAELAADPMVGATPQYVSPAQAVANYRETVSAQVGQYTQEGDLPAYFIVKLKDIKKDYDAFLAKYKDKPGVSSTQNASDVLKKLLNVIDGARLFSLVIAIVVLVASILLIANTIQVAAAQRKNETSIMRLVGASRWMTELPFMLETMIATLLGGIISVGLIWVGKHYVLNNIFGSQVTNGVIPNLGTNDVLEAGGVGLIAGLVLAALTAFATLRLYVRL